MHEHAHAVPCAWRHEWAGRAGVRGGSTSKQRAWVTARYGARLGSVPGPPCLLQACTWLFHPRANPAAPAPPQPHRPAPGQLSARTRLSDAKHADDGHQHQVGAVEPLVGRPQRIVHLQLLKHCTGAARKEGGGCRGGEGRGGGRCASYLAGAWCGQDCLSGPLADTQPPAAASCLSSAAAAPHLVRFWRGRAVAAGAAASSCPPPPAVHQSARRPAATVCALGLEEGRSTGQACCRRARDATSLPPPPSRTSSPPASSSSSRSSSGGSSSTKSSSTKSSSSMNRLRGAALFSCSGGQAAAGSGRRRRAGPGVCGPCQAPASRPAPGSRAGKHKRPEAAKHTTPAASTLLSNAVLARFSPTVAMAPPGR